MRLTPVVIILFAGIALVTATPAAPKPDPWIDGLDPTKPETVLHHCKGIQQHDARIRSLLLDAGPQKIADEIPLLMIERVRHVDARDKSARAIAEHNIPFEHPRSTIPQVQADHHSNSIRHHKAKYEDDLREVEGDVRFLRYEQVRRQARTQSKVAQLAAQVDVRRTRMAEHAANLAILKHHNPEITLDHDTVAFMAPRLPSQFRSRMRALPPPSSPPSFPHSGGSIAPSSPTSRFGGSGGVRSQSTANRNDPFPSADLDGRQRRPSPQIHQRQGSPVTASRFALPEYTDQNRRRFPLPPPLFSTSQYGVVGNHPPSAAPSSSAQGGRGLSISSLLNDSPEKPEIKRQRTSR